MSDESKPIDPEEFFTEAACWSGGIGREWESGDVLIGSEFYSAMIDLLLHYVPTDRLQAFMFEWNSAK